MGVEIVDAGPFNQQVDLMGNKASVNFGAAMRHVDRIWNRWPQDHPRVIVDRQGGVLSFLGVMESGSKDLPATDADLFDRFGVHLPEAPWYDSVTELPVANDLDQLRISTSRLRRTLKEQQVHCSSMGVEIEVIGYGCRSI